MGQCMWCSEYTRFAEEDAEAQRWDVTEPVLWGPPVSDDRANGSCSSRIARFWALALSAEPLRPVHPPAGAVGHEGPVRASVQSVGPGSGPDGACGVCPPAAGTCARTRLTGLANS